MFYFLIEEFLHFSSFLNNLYICVNIFKNLSGFNLVEIHGLFFIRLYHIYNHNNHTFIYTIMIYHNRDNQIYHNSPIN